MKKLVDILSYKCPNCRKEGIFITPFRLKEPVAMHKKCPNCQYDLEREPGFYFGAMYISYGLSTFLLFLPGMILYLLTDLSFNLLIGMMILASLLSYLKFMRLSRSIWLYLMGDHKE